MAPLTGSDVESAALAWLGSIGWQVKHGAEIAPGEGFAERSDYGQVVLAQRLRDALARLNPNLSPEALEEAFRRITDPPGATLEARNRAFHRMLVDGVTVEYRRPDGSIAGAQARTLDFDDPDSNDWLAVNQFTVSENRHTRRADIVLFVNGLPLAVIPCSVARGCVVSTPIAPRRSAEVCPNNGDPACATRRNHTRRISAVWAMANILFGR